MGPAPVRADSAAAPLSAQRATVLERLQQGGAAVQVADLAVELALHPNTVRQHLDALHALGLVVRSKAPAVGRGRPAWTYAAAAGWTEPDRRVRDYAGLATALADHIARTSPNPRADALAAGEAWGRSLVAAASAGSEAPPPGGSIEGARHRVVDLLAGLGFDPEADSHATTVALRRCPLLDAARQHPQVVCAVHLGIVRSALTVLGGDPRGTDLVPFAEPGACRLHLSD